VRCRLAFGAPRHQLPANRWPASGLGTEVNASEKFHTISE
jgi:hypothetical protein